MVDYQVILDKEGRPGVVETQALQGGDTELWVTLEDDQRLPIPSRLLVLSDNKQYSLPYLWSDLLKQHTTQTRLNPAVDANVIPVIEETVEVDKRWVENGQVRLHKRTHEYEEQVQTTLRQQQVDVERVPKNEPVTDIPAVRYEGETMIIPVVEEVVVVEKRLILKEEIRVTKREVETPWEQTVMLRKEEVVVEHTTPQSQEMVAKSE